MNNYGYFFQISDYLIVLCFKNLDSLLCHSFSMILHNKCYWSSFSDCSSFPALYFYIREVSGSLNEGGIISTEQVWTRKNICSERKGERRWRPETQLCKGRISDVIWLNKLEEIMVHGYSIWPSAWFFWLYYHDVVHLVGDRCLLNSHQQVLLSDFRKWFVIKCCKDHGLPNQQHCECMQWSISDPVRKYGWLFRNVGSMPALSEKNIPFFLCRCDS